MDHHQRWPVMQNVIRFRKIMTPTRTAIGGTLVGVAIGDAMGAPFEGFWPMTFHPLNRLLHLFANRKSNLPASTLTTRNQQ